MSIARVLARHERIALQFSGGKDSLAVLHYLRPHWDRLTVYWCNPGDAYPETLALMESVRSMTGLVEISGQLDEVRKYVGWSTDLLPAGSTPLGVYGGSGNVPLIDRYSCCAHSMMAPLHQRMLDDYITLIIRGQREADVAKSKVRSGDVRDGFEFLFPIEDWSDAQVTEYLVASNVVLPRYVQEGMSSMPDCMSCTAYLEHGGQRYLQRHYPEQYPEIQSRLRQIGVVVAADFGRLMAEIE